MKRRFPIVFLLIMIFGIFSYQAVFAADDDIASGGYADWTYRITSQGELIIGSETGETQNLRMPADHKAPWEEYADKITSASFSGTVNGQDIGGLFRECINLRSIDFTGLNTNNATYMGAMFLNCKSLTSLDLSSFNTNNVTDMDSMFRGCENLDSLNISNFYTGKVSSIAGMFADCRSLSSLDLSGFDTSHVSTSQGMNEMFAGCESLTSLDLSSFNTSNVTNMGYMFTDCSALLSLNLSSFDMSKVSYASNMLQGCSSLQLLRSPTNVTIEISLPLPMYNSEGIEYNNLLLNFGSSVYLYNEPVDVSVTSVLFVESPSLNGQPREKMYGEPFAGVEGDKVIVTLSDGNVVTFEYTVNASGAGSWVGSSTGSLYETPTLRVYCYNSTESNYIYNTHVGDVVDLFVRLEGTINGLSFSGSQPYTTKIVDCPGRIRVGDIVYHQSTDSALVYGFRSLSDYSNTVVFPDSVTFGSGKTTDVFNFEWFQNLPQLTSIILPEKTESINSNCFLNTGLTEITIPKACERIGSYALGYVDHYNKVDGFIIRGYKGTAAETYAKENGFTFIDISGEPDDPDEPDDPTPEPVSIAGAAVSNILTKTYTGRAITQMPVVKLNGVTLRNGTDYSLSYKNNINAGLAASVTITGKGSYTGSITKTFTINPAVPSLKLSKVTKGSKSFTAKWKKATTAVQKKFTGYQIQYSTSKDFKKSVKVQSTTQKKASKVIIRKLKKKKTYYVRIRRYLKWNGRMVYSAWSPVKRVKTK